jgi:hypothetical protein
MIPILSGKTTKEQNKNKLGQMSKAVGIKGQISKAEGFLKKVEKKHEERRKEKTRASLDQVQHLVAKPESPIFSSYNSQMCDLPKNIRILAILLYAEYLGRRTAARPAPLRIMV